ncbi:MAG: zinc-ribbon domain-containing protein [Erysipelotrichaceae bacterium]|nr:zinc-ribbon domain-containing protein [Erysipelotrichaceae bacterium]
MFIVWGSKTYNDDLGPTKVKRTCEHCNNEVVMRVMCSRRKFTLFWIPLFTTSTTYFLHCPICNYGATIDKETALGLLQNNASA